MLGIRSVAATPGNFESESLVLAYGHDLYCTRLSPSRSFDLLGETFNRIQLFIVLLILCVALTILRVTVCLQTSIETQSR